MSGRPPAIAFATLTGPAEVRATLIHRLADPRLILLHHQAETQPGPPQCLCCAGETDMARHLETLLRDIDNGRAERPQGIILLLDTGNDPAIPLGLILRHPYFRLRFSPVRSVATRHDATAPDLADLVIDVEETGPDELLAALSAPVSRPPALRERLYRTAMIPPARR